MIYIFDMSKHTTVRLPEDLLRRAKRKAAAEGRTLTALIEDGLRLVVAERRPIKSKRVVPCISEATGGLLPGVDLDKMSDLQDAEDLEYVARMKRM
jgi:hypothetical protein